MTVADANAEAASGAVGPAPNWCYRAFGMVIRSDMPIEELASSAADPTLPHDLEIVLRSDPRSFDFAKEPFDFKLHSEEDGTDYLYWDIIGGFRILGSDRIEYDPKPGVGSDLLSLPLLGIVMAVLLHRRGLMVLHGSAVDIAGRAVIFVGDKGAGKSTTAAALASAGRKILTDDVVALQRWEDGTVRLLPGHAQLKLSQDATDHMNLSGVRVLDQPFEGYDKQRHVFEDEFDTDPVPVSDIFILERGELGIEAFAGTQAFTAVMRFSYLARFGADIFRGEQGRLFMQWCADVVRTTPVGRLTVPPDLAGLGKLVGFLDDHAHRTHGQS